MSQDLTAVILSLGPGAMLGLLALGLVMIYRSTGVLNLAHGSMAGAGAYIYVDLIEGGGFSAPVALAVASLGVGVLAVVIYWLVMRPLRQSSPLTRLVATAGVLVIIQSILELRYGNLFIDAKSVLPTGTVDLPGGTTMGLDRILLVVIAVALTAALWMLYRFTSFGLATEAASENSLVAAAYGLRSERLAVVNWFISGVVTGLAGCLLAPIIGLNLQSLSTLIVPVMAAALVGALRSFPLALVGGMLLVSIQTEVSLHTTTRGAAEVVPLVLIVLILVLRGQSIPTRSEVGLKLPSVGRGLVRWPVVAILVIAFIVSIYTWFPEDEQRSLLVNLVTAVILLSLVVILGYAGQISLALFGFAGFGAYIAVHMASDRGWSLVPAMLAGIVAAGVLGAIVALPSMRLRGVSLAVVTLAFGVMLYAVLLGQADSVRTGSPTLFGLDMNFVLEPERYLLLAFFALVGCMLVVANLRRSASGRRMIAMRGDERAAASIGVNIGATKVGAFAISAMIAAVGGVLKAFQSSATTFTEFTPTASIQGLGWAVIGGVGYIPGAVLGTLLAPSNLLSELLASLYDDKVAVLGLIGGLGLISVLLMHPNGLATLPADLARHSKRLTSRRSAKAGPRVVPIVEDGAPRVHQFSSLRVQGVGVSFGGVRALSDVSLEVTPGQVHGLIGPNGAGKTTLLDVVSGFVTPDSGGVKFDDTDVAGLPVHQRARAGLGRSFQGVQLFADLSVLENVRVACDQYRPLGMARDLVRPGEEQLTPRAWKAIETLELVDLLDSKIDDLSHGQRQLVSIARALAANPHVVMLDEPAAGLDDRERRELGTLIRSLVAENDLGVLLVEHDVELVLDICDWVTVLHGGRVLAAGTPAEIRASQEVRTAYLGEGSSAEDELEENPQEVGGHA